MDDIINQLNGIIPSKYLSLLTALYVFSTAAGRIVQAIRTGGGLKSILTGLWLGTNVPKDVKEAVTGNTQQFKAPNSQSGFARLGVMAGIAALSIAVCGALVLGCKTTPDTAAYKAASATQLGAEEALRLWDVYLQTQRTANHPVSLDDELRVKKAYDRYRTASYLVIDAGRAYTRARSLGNDATAADLYQSALKSAAEANTDLFNLLQSLGLKLIPTN